MKKRIIVILVAILVVLLAAIAVVEIVRSNDNDSIQGYDEIDGSVGSDIDEIFDLETGELIEDLDNNKSNSDSSTDSDVSNSVDEDDSVSSNNKNENSSGNSNNSESSKNDTSSSNKDNSTSSKNESHLSNIDDLVILDEEDVSDVVFNETITEIGGTTTDSPKEDLYVLKGVLVVDGKPLANTKLELHSKVKTTTTDKNGNFAFNDVELGSHKLTVLKNDKKIAEMSFELKKGSKTSVKKSFFKKYYTLSIAENSGGIEFKVSLNEKKGTLKFSDPEVVEKPETNSNGSSGVTSSNSSSTASSDTSSNTSSSVSSNTSSNTSSMYLP